MDLEQNIINAIHAIHFIGTQEEATNILEALRILKTASLDYHCRPFIRLHGGLQAIITCMLHHQPATTAWVQLEIIETSATALLSPYPTAGPHQPMPSLH